MTNHLVGRGFWGPLGDWLNVHLSVGPSARLFNCHKQFQIIGKITTIEIDKGQLSVTKVIT